MGDPWCPFASHDGGANANYESGRNRMEVTKCHFTVGRNSYGVGINGYFHFLADRDGRLHQFAPVDAVCWDSSEWNDAGPGIEVEYLDEPTVFTPESLATVTRLCEWLHTEHGIPFVHWPGERIYEFAGWRGFIDHADLIQTNQHYDFWPDDAVMAIFADRATPKTSEATEMEYLVKNKDDGQWYHFPPFCAKARPVDPGFVLARASFMPHGESNGPTIVAMDAARQQLRQQFIAEIKAA